MYSCSSKKLQFLELPAANISDDSCYYRPTESKGKTLSVGISHCFFCAGSRESCDTPHQSHCVDTLPRFCIRPRKMRQHLQLIQSTRLRRHHDAALLHSSVKWRACWFVCAPHRNYKINALVRKCKKVSIGRDDHVFILHMPTMGQKTQAANIEVVALYRIGNDCRVCILRNPFSQLP
jgi:hypothetical protein